MARKANPIARVGNAGLAAPTNGPAPSKNRHALAPFKWGLIWLLGTFVLFLLVGEVGRVPDMFLLTAFVLGATFAFAAGYWLKLRTWSHSSPLPADDDTSLVRTLVVISALYCSLFGLAFLNAYGASGPGELFEAIRNPGAAYFNRLREAELENGSTILQLLTLGAALTTPLVPFTLIWWNTLGAWVKSLAASGLILYLAYWFFIGTQKGIGDFACYALVALLARAAISGRRLGRKAIAGIVIVTLGFAAYMVVNQTDRLTSQNTSANIRPNPVATAIAGEAIGRGVTSTLGYPTHGYLGLAQNLGTPVKWTKFRGSSRAFDSYWIQYVDGNAEPSFPDTVPARTEQRTGWPALMYWSTIYPWIASDLTWWGVPLFMFTVGWWTAKWWLETIYLRSKLALLLVCQMAILIAYVPANNQLGITRPGLIAFATLLVLYAARSINSLLSRATRPKLRRS